MYKIKRHKLLNLQYLHDPYSGPITDEYEVIDKADTWSEAYRKLKEYQENLSPNIDGIFEDYYKYEHMKEVWGDPIGLLKDCQDYNALRPHRIILSQHRREWDLPKQGPGKSRKSIGA